MVAMIISVDDRFANSGNTKPLRHARTNLDRTKAEQDRKREVKNLQRLADHEHVGLIMRSPVPPECWFG